ncbi:hypothetical protein [Streptomyces sp. NPDC018031]|uniref:hypothetical protein n=1 Tax=Streptomyces sp. NPDC018031 TaxID=3365033 RepID=UPI0037AF255B
MAENLDAFLYAEHQASAQPGEVYNTEAAQGRMRNDTGYDAELYASPDASGASIQTLGPGESADLGPVASVRFLD